MRLLWRHKIRVKNKPMPLPIWAIAKIVKYTRANVARVVVAAAFVLQINLAIFSPRLVGAIHFICRARMYTKKYAEKKLFFFIIIYLEKGFAFRCPHFACFVTAIIIWRRRGDASVIIWILRPCTSSKMSIFFSIIDMILGVQTALFDSLWKKRQKMSQSYIRSLVKLCQTHKISATFHDIQKNSIQT